MVQNDRKDFMHFVPWRASTTSRHVCGPRGGVQWDNWAEFSQTVHGPVSLLCCLTQKYCQARPQWAIGAFSLLFTLQELVNSGNSWSFAPAPFHLTQLSMVFMNRQLAVAGKVSRSSVSVTFQRAFWYYKLCKPMINGSRFIPCYYKHALLCPWYKSVLQLSFGLYGIHNLVTVALGILYPVETSTTYTCTYPSILRVLCFCIASLKAVFPCLKIWFQWRLMEQWGVQTY